MNVPPIKASNQAKALTVYATATEAVAEGTATHAQKHRAAYHAMRQKIRQQRALANPGK